jgi:hypothetical protein
MDPELLRQMQALGYLGGEDGRNGDAPTPKVPQEEPVPDEDEAPKEQGDKP